MIEAIRLLRESGVERSIAEAQVLLSARRRQLGVPLDPPEPEAAELATELKAMHPSLLAVEALWDGDTVHDWFVLRVAVVRDPAEPRGASREAVLRRFTGSTFDARRRAIEVGRGAGGRCERAVPLPNE